MKRQSRDAQAWRSTAAGLSSYQAARAEAQATANALGLDVGLEANDLFRTWRAFLLPARSSRQGHELRCEVVSPESIPATQPGHGVAS